MIWLNGYQMKKYDVMNIYSIVMFESEVIDFIFFDLCNYDCSSTTLHKINYKDNLFPPRQSKIVIGIHVEVITLNIDNINFAYIIALF